MRKLSFIFTVLGIIAVFGLAAIGRWSPSFEQPKASPIVSIEHTTPSPNVTYSFFAETSGQTALDVLATKVEMELATTSSGTQVTAINTVKNNDERQWVMLVNGVPATRGAEKVVLNTGDELMLSFQEK